MSTAQQPRPQTGSKMDTAALSEASAFDSAQCCCCDSSPQDFSSFIAVVSVRMVKKVFLTSSDLRPHIWTSHFGMSRRK